MDKSLEKCNFKKLNDEEAENLNRLITVGEIETILPKLPTHKSPGPESFTGEFYKTFKEELIPNFHRLFQKIQNDGRLPNCFNEINIILIPKSDKDITKKENFRPTLVMNMDAKSSTKYGQTTCSNTLKRSYTMTKWYSQGCKDGTIFANQ